MTEGNWITMPGVPLITAGGPEVAAREEGEVTGAPGDEAGAAEDTTSPTTKEERTDGAPGPTAEVERTEAAEETVPPAPTSARAAPSPKLSLRPHPTRPPQPPPAPKRMPEQTLRRRRTSWSLRPHCWPPALPSTRVLRSLQPTQPPCQLRLLLSPKELRSEAHRACLVNRRSASFWSHNFVKNTNVRYLCAGSFGGTCVGSRRCERFAFALKLFFCCAKCMDEI
jgi:hypothetical protein